MNKGHSMMRASQCINGEDKCACRPETKCCSTTPTLEKAKQLMEEHVRHVEEVSRVTVHSQYPERMESFSGYATVLLADLQAVQDDLLLAQLVAPASPQVEPLLGDGLQEMLTLCRSRLGKCSQLVMALALRSQREAALAGQQQTAG